MKNVVNIMSLVFVLHMASCVLAEAETFYWDSSGGDTARLQATWPNGSDQAFRFGHIVGNSTTPGRQLLRFSGVDTMFSTVTSAILQLNNQSPWIGANMDVAIHGVTEYWVYGEYNYTWNTQPSYDPTPVLLQNTPWGDWSGNYDQSYDITSLVQGWVAGTYPNYGILIKQDNETITQDLWGFIANGSGPTGPALTVTGTLTSRPTVYVEEYGAVGDGLTDDTSAFQLASQAIQRADGGTLALQPGKTYRVGRQVHTPGVYPYYRTSPIIRIDGVNPAKVSIIGNGSTIKLNDGLRFGSFDKDTGEVYNPTMPFTDYNYRADAGNIINITNCSDVEIRNVKLDGNIDNLNLGGFWGSSGRQCAATGIRLYGNKIANIYDVESSYHGLDGIMIGYPGLTASSPATPHYLQNVQCYYNARQGLSWVGGIGLTALNCKFSHTGKGRFVSAPGAGLDLEAENSVCRNGNFTTCEFVNNVGAGVIADSGDVANSVFTGCLIWGTTNWSIWPRKPGLKFVNCTVYGTVVNTYGSNVVSEATQFIGCTFEDVQGQQYPTYTGEAIVQCWGQNVTFDGCTIVANTKRALFMDHTPSQEVLRNCHIYHKWTGLANGSNQSAFRGSYLENTQFHEALGTTNSYYIYVSSVLVGPGVVVDGPRCKWQSVNGLTGTIPEGTY